MSDNSDRSSPKDSAPEQRIVERSGPGWFTTTLVLEDPVGEKVVWHSRRNRKGLDAEPAHRVGRTRPRYALAFNPGSVTWWIAVLFMIGAALFAVGSASVFLGADLANLSGPIFFTGSIFFTSAAYLQIFEVINEPDALTHKRPRRALLRWEPHKIGWWAAIVQFIGTLLFNVNTFEAARVLTPSEQERLVWTPDAMGSICFLVASYLAYVEVCRRWTAWQPRNISWWIVVINLLGSVAFGISAVASFVIVQTGELVDAQAANVWTFGGAVCFFIGAYLLLPEMTAHAKSRESPTYA